MAGIGTMLKATGKHIAFVAKEKAPVLYFAGGALALVGMGIYVWKARPKVTDIYDELQDDLVEIEDNKNAASEAPEPNENINVQLVYTKKEEYFDKARAYGRAVGKTAIAFAPAVLYGSAALACFGASTMIFRKRFLVISAAYAGLSREHNLLRDAIVLKYGKDKLDELMRDGPVENSSEGPTENDDSPTEKNIQVRKVYTANTAFFGPGYSVYAEKDPEANRNFLWNMQNTLTDKLRAGMSQYKPGRLTLNEVRVALGLEETEEGDYLGWTVYANEEDNKRYGCRGSVDFGVFDINSDGRVMKLSGARMYDTLELKFNVDDTPLMNRCGRPKR